MKLLDGKMGNKEILNKIKGILLRKKRVSLGIGAVLVSLALAFTGVYALGSEKRALEEAEIQRKEAEIQLKKDQSLALLEAEKMKQEMLDRSERTKDAIISKGEYSPLTATTERQPEVSTRHENGLSKWLSKNVLRLHIDYEIKYVIDMEKISPIVTEEGVYIEFKDEDFEVDIIPLSYTLMTPNDDEVGVFPSEFKNEDVIALISANAKVVAEEYSTNEENIRRAVDETKLMIEGLADSFNSKVTFVDKRINKSLNVNISTEEIKGDKNE